MTNAELQQVLIALGFKPGSIDGKSGPLTKAGFVAFQRANGLVPDGIAGPQTETALQRALAAPKSARPEPDKTAMQGEVPCVRIPGGVVGAPPNVTSLKLLDTARPIDTIFIHCTATPEGKDYTVDDIRSWHKQRGFSDIGYHYVIYRDGRIMVGRPIGQVGAHVESHNTGSIGISYVGGVSADGKVAKDTRTPAQRSALL
ncbi:MULTISPECIES: peptidoglycan-binding protein [unclassified Bosea (in: a-proteobacteria)]|uniref:peptidoglycan recognition protein family protein n=1 Tax=unclassified Bosea (in: a-proteobacteria) TaxID=2653178 RepID=UPI0019D6D946|nr:MULTISPECIES: peptidoglycan-binding protein [unclassified Bosea (in: a-proteobacteria)]